MKTWTVVEDTCAALAWADRHCAELAADRAPRVIAGRQCRRQSRDRLRPASRIDGGLHIDVQMLSYPAALDRLFPR